MNSEMAYQTQGAFFCFFSPTSTSLVPRNRENVQMCPPNDATQVKINCHIYPNVKITLTLKLTTLLQIGNKCLDFASGSVFVRINSSTTDYTR